MMQENAQKKIETLNQSKNRILFDEEREKIKQKWIMKTKLMSDELSRKHGDRVKPLSALTEFEPIKDGSEAPMNQGECQRCLKPYRYDIKYIDEDLADLGNEERTLGKGTQRFIAKVARWTRTSPSSLNSRWKRYKFAQALKARGLNLPLSVITPNRINACKHA